MKLKQISSKEPMVRIAVSVKRSSSELLEAYRESYAVKYGETIDNSSLVETIIREFITTDREFMKDFNAQQEKALQEAKDLEELEEATSGHSASSPIKPETPPEGSNSFKKDETSTTTTPSPSVGIANSTNPSVNSTSYSSANRQY